MSAPRLHSCAAGRDDDLAAELALTYPHSEHERIAPGWVFSRLAGPDAVAACAVAFARQCLTNPAPVAAPSVSSWASLVTERILETLRGHDGPWRLHVFCADLPGGAAPRRRCALIDAEIDVLLKKKQRRLLRSRVRDARPFAGDEVLVQVALLAPTRGFLSVAWPEDRHLTRRVLSRFPGGEIDVPDDPRPPSRAYKKLLEAEAHLGRAIVAGERCADLGGAPGGWTFVALERGARVVAVDRSPLRADLMASPRLTFVRGDGFSWKPDAPVDWLLCDIIAFPERSVDLIERWVRAGWCTRFIVTLKFRGQAALDVVQRAKAVCEDAGYDLQLRQLAANKNEVTAMGAGRAGLV